MPTKQILSQVHLSPQLQAGRSPILPVPGQKIPRSLHSSLILPQPQTHHLFSAPSAPSSTLSPRQCSQGDISSSPAPGPWDRPLFDCTACPTLPASPQPLLHLQMGCLLPCFCPPRFPAQNSFPMRFADLSSAVIGGFVQVTAFPQSQPPKRPPQWTLYPTSPFWTATPRDRLGSVGPPWAALRSSWVTSIGSEEITSQGPEPHRAWPTLRQGSCHSAPTMLASP